MFMYKKTYSSQIFSVRFKSSHIKEKSSLFLECRKYSIPGIRAETVVCEGQESRHVEQAGSSDGSCGGSETQN